MCLFAQLEHALLKGKDLVLHLFMSPTPQILLGLNKLSIRDYYVSVLAKYPYGEVLRATTRNLKHLCFLFSKGRPRASQWFRMHIIKWQLGGGWLLCVTLILKRNKRKEGITQKIIVPWPRLCRIHSSPMPSKRFFVSVLMTFLLWKSFRFIEQLQR